MTTSEFSSEFDLLYDNIASASAPGLDEYEKSVFLTKAQDGVIINLYNGKNPSGDSFEKTEEIRRYLGSLVKTENLNFIKGYVADTNPATIYEDAEHEHSIIVKDKSVYYDITNKIYYISVANNTEPITYKFEKINTLSSDSYIFKLPDNLWFITYESARLKTVNGCLNQKEIEVIPATQDDLHKVKNNPFRGPSETRALRLDVENNTVELISKYPIDRYTVRYVADSSPIILTDLGEDPGEGEVYIGLTIKGEYKKTECKLPDSLHRAILDMAVQMAIQSMAQTV